MTEPSHELAANERASMTIGTLLITVAAVAALLALGVRVRQAYAAVPATAVASHPEGSALIAFIAWIVLSAVTAVLLRGARFSAIPARVLATTLIYLTRLAVPISGPYGTEYYMFWPLYCFGIGVTGPLLLRRWRPPGLPWLYADGMLLVLVDSASAALLVSVFADFVPKL